MERQKLRKTMTSKTEMKDNDYTILGVAENSPRDCRISPHIPKNSWRTGQLNGTPAEYSPMARNEADREDLFAEAVTLVRRVEGQLAGCAESILAGIKASGDTSFYFGPNRVYHVDGEGRFRRAFVAGFLYRSQGDRLTRLRRNRTETETALLRIEMTDHEAAEFQTAMHDALRTFQTAITSGSWGVLRQQPVDDHSFETEIAAMIDTILSATPWLAPALVVRR